MIVHGTMREMEPRSDAAGGYDALVHELYPALYGPGWVDWYDKLDHSGDVRGRIEARRIFARRA